jgi:hypothetical protein
MKDNNGLAAVQGFMSVGSSSDIVFILAVRCEDNIQKDVMEVCCEGERWIELAMLVTSSGLCVEPLGFTTRLFLKTVSSPVHAKLRQ